MSKQQNLPGGRRKIVTTCRLFIKRSLVRGGHIFAKCTYQLTRFPARLLLLVHILRNAHKINEGFTSFQLKAVTDKLSLNDKQRRWLNEIYKLRSYEERLLREEIGMSELSALACSD